MSSFVNNWNLPEWVIMWCPKSTFHTTCPFQATSEMTVRTWLGSSDGTILMDLSEAYDCFSHDVLIVKLESYGLDIGRRNFLLDYLRLRKYRTKIGCSYSKWSEICREIPQDSILGPLLFNIFINNIFFSVVK